MAPMDTVKILGPILNYSDHMFRVRENEKMNSALFGLFYGMEQT